MRSSKRSSVNGPSCAAPSTFAVESASLVARENGTAGVTLDAPLPPKWTPLEYVTWSARLAGRTNADAKTLAKEALGHLELGALSAKQLSILAPAPRRAVLLAAALVTGAEILAIENPVDGLPEELARSLAGAFVTALEGRSWIVFAPRLQLTSPFVLGAKEALVVSSTQLEAQGIPVELATKTKRFVVRTQGSMEELAERLKEHGATFEVSGAQTLLDLGENLGTARFLGMCDEARITVVEMIPTTRAFDG